jgi:ubiquinone/menaquinone biosynthesis C-methylase UbiE
MDTSHSYARTDGLTSRIAGAVDRSFKKNTTNWPRLIGEIIGGVSSSRSGSRAVLNLVDETKASVKFLLTISPGDHVLNLGPGWDNTTINLARNAAKVTALDLNLAGLYILLLKGRYYGLDNIDLLFGGADKYWPIRDQTFDAVIVQDSLIWSLLSSVCANQDSDGQHLPGLEKRDISQPNGGSPQGAGLHTLLMEIKRVLKPGGEIFLGVKSYPDTAQIRSELEKTVAWLHKTYIPNAMRGRWLSGHVAALGNRHQFDRIIERSGLNKGRVYWITPTAHAPERIRDVSARRRVYSWVTGVERFTKALLEKKRRGHGPYIGRTCYLSGSGQSWIEGMILDFTRSCPLSAKTCRLDRLQISRKGKLIVILRDIRSKKSTWVIKVPLHPVSHRMLENNYHTLDRISNMRPRGEKQPLFQEAIPSCMHTGTHKGQVYFAEKGIAGVEWKKVFSAFSDKLIWQRTLRLLRSLNRIPVVDGTPEKTLSKYNKRFDCIESILNEHPGSEKRVWEKIKGSLIDSMRQCNGRQYFRKGDFSMHNVMVTTGKHPALIDFDESDTTAFKTVDLADLLFSYVRIRKKIDRAAFLSIMARGEFKQIGLSLALTEILDYLDADEADLRISAFVSWIDHVYYALQFEPIKYRKYILNQSFAKTLQALEPVADII